MKKKELFQKVNELLAPPGWDEEAMRRKAYGDPLGDPHGLGNKEDPLEELVFILLSNQATLEQAAKAYNNLDASKDWKQIRDAPLEVVEKKIEPVGAQEKAGIIQEILRQIHADPKAKGFDLGFLNDMKDSEAFAWLTELRGVAEKTAHCVMLFSLNRNVLPVDRHVHRIIKRMGLVGPKSGSEEANKDIQQFVPENSALSLHVNLFEHGRNTCRPTNPDCDNCVIEHLCAYAGHHVLRTS